jgi:Holliday junction resolvase RusA-like endonuclease
MKCVGRKGRHQLVDTKRDLLDPWRATLRAAGEALMRRHGLELIEAPVVVEATFTVARPASVKPAERPWPHLKAARTADGGGDLDKLQRAVGDAWSGVVFRDDSQVCSWRTTKTYSDGPAPDRLERPGALIRLHLL